MTKFSLKNISFSQIISIILIILALIFIAQNFQEVYITIILWTFPVPLFILLAITFLIGFYTAVVFGKDRTGEIHEVEINKNLK